MSNQSEQDYTHPDEMPIVEQRPNPYSDLRGTIVHFTSEMLDNPNNYGIYPTTNFYNDLEEAILDWHNRQVEQAVREARIDPFDFVEPCEPDCDEVRHAYHQGQWDMATRIEAKQEEL